MEKIYDGFDFDTSSVSVRYGKYNGKINYQKIAQLEEPERTQTINALVEEFIQKKEETGFWCPNDVIYINRLYGNAFKIDDNEIYHLFFKKLQNNLEKTKDTLTSGAIVMMSVQDTIYDYFGKFDGDEKKRYNLTTSYFDENDNYVVPSIKSLKKQHASACVEYSSLAHNLWLLTGVKSYYILSKDTKFQTSNDGHAFVVVEYGGKCRLFDMALSSSGYINPNPIELFDNKQPLIINGNIYANASYAENPEMK